MCCVGAAVLCPQFYQCLVRHLIDPPQVYGISLAHDPQRDDHQFTRIKNGACCIVLKLSSNKSPWMFAGVEHYLDYGKKAFNDTREEVSA